MSWMLCRSLLSIFIFTLLRLPAVAVGGDNVTLKSLQIFRTHELFGKPSVYFKCQEEEKVHLPDVVLKDHQYNFIGEESWQPLTSLEGVKCKRCGVYEEDQLKYDDVFDEWELCPTQFSTEPEGQYYHFKDDEFNMTLICPHCHPMDAKSGEDEPSSANDEDDDDQRKKHKGLVIVLVFFGVVALSALAFVAYIRWQRKQREEQQARFMKLFEDDEDLEAEFGLRDD